MSIPIDRLVAQLTPNQTALFLGAGASVESGSPTGEELAELLWLELGSGEPPSLDLVEVASILELRRGRAALYKAVLNHLAKLEPTGGLLLLPLLSWKVLYTTNFDRLIEKAFSHANVPLVVVRSNYEYQAGERRNEIGVFKIHGCISQDESTGSRARMTLTERDYEEYAGYREALFRKLELDLLGGDVVFVGYSLRDRHLRDRIVEAARAKSNSGAPGRIFALLFEANEDRANLLERRGVEVAFGSLDTLLSALLERGDFESSAAVESPSGLSIPKGTYLSSVEVGHAKTLEPDASRLFNGGAATYADVAAGLTFARDLEGRFKSEFLDPATNRIFWIITGVAGVGKTSLARRLLALASEQGYLCWEHKDETVLTASDWVAVEASLRAAKKKAILLVDECLQFSRQTSILAEALAKTQSVSLQLLLTANQSQWYRRVKSPVLTKQGITTQLSKLSLDEIESLMRLVEEQSAIRTLVDTAFARLSTPERRAHLRQRCSADMYVCLKNIFAFEQLDTILLREFGQLPESLQEVYRNVAALQAAGTRVHRQLVVRTLGIPATVIGSILEELDGLVEEYDIEPSEGLYGWSTRHQVIATTIAQYKFSDQAELFALLTRVVEGLNPALRLELRTLRDLCNSDFGVERLSSADKQIELYRKLIALAPGERIPYHRLIGALLRNERTDPAAQAIRAAEAAVGQDAVISRYKVLQAIQRAELTKGILKEDRLAMLRNAETLAFRGIQRFSEDKYAYTVYAQVGVAIAELSGITKVLEDAIEQMRSANDELVDVLLSERLFEFEAKRRDLMQRGAISG
jgi:hypothetical protein